MSNADGIILGLDPGLRVTGYGLLEVSAKKPCVREAGVIRATATGRRLDLADRLRVLYDSLTELIEQFRPQTLAIEQLYAHYKHPRTAILMGHARGVLLLAGARLGVTIVSFSATTIKKTITGSGRAPKIQVQRAVQRELGLAQLPEPPDVADALAAALCQYYVRERRIDRDSPRRKIGWPSSEVFPEAQDD
jgi:crossover junction endodeoxyribonuclease RuvC